VSVRQHLKLAGREVDVGTDDDQAAVWGRAGPCKDLMPRKGRALFLADAGPDKRGATR